MTEKKRNPMRVVRVSEVLDEYNLSPTTVKNWEELGIFPKRRKFGPRNVGWFQSEFEQALKDLAAS